MNIIIRHEEEQDFRIVENITREAFWDLHVPGCDEHYLLHCMRNHPDFIHELDFVAEYNELIVGNIVYSKAQVHSNEGDQLDVLSFGPISVLPDYQRKGIGTQLIHHTFEIVRKMGIPLVIIYGHPGNYVKHGFRNAIDYHITDQNGRNPLSLLVKELIPGFLNDKKWRFICSDIYAFDPHSAEKYDQTFPHKEKKEQPSQIEFQMMCRAFVE